jgi:hypothetical protein
LVFRRGFAILDIEPFGSPPLDRCGKGKFEVLRLRAHRDNGSPQFRLFRQRNIRAKSKIDLQRRKWGSMPKNDSQRVTKQAI